MRRIGILCFLVALVTAAGASAAAASAPLYEECVKQSGGHYTSKECTASSEVPKGGTFERREVAEGAKIAFEAKLGAVTLQKVGGPPMLECKSGGGEGSITGPSSAELVLELKACRNAAEPSEKCETPGARKGITETAELQSELVELPGAKAGIRLSAAGTLVEFTCRFFGGIVVTVRGSVLGEAVGDVGAARKAQLLSLRIGPGGDQEFTNVEGGTEGEDALRFDVMDAGEEEGLVSLGLAGLTKTKPAIGIF